jgi:hypothetical protein
MIRQPCIALEIPDPRKFKLLTTGIRTCFPGGLATLAAASHLADAWQSNLVVLKLRAFVPGSGFIFCGRAEREIYLAGLFGTYEVGRLIGACERYL